jgi:hypothetical protein
VPVARLRRLDLPAVSTGAHFASMSPPKPEDSTTPRLCRQTYWSRVAFCGGIQPEVAEARQRPICGRAPTRSRPPAGHSDAPSVHYRRLMRRCGLMRMGISASRTARLVRIWSVPCPGHLLLCYRLPCPQVTAYRALLLDPSEPMWCRCPLPGAVRFGRRLGREGRFGSGGDVEGSPRRGWACPSASAGLGWPPRASEASR